MHGVARFASVLTFALAILAGQASAALAHEEREVTLPDGSGSVPEYRPDGPRLLVCKTDLTDFERRIADFPEELRQRNLALFKRCQQDGYRHLQAAVDAVDHPGTNIAILPGAYREEPSRETRPECRDLDAPWAQIGKLRYQVLSYTQQERCPHKQNLVAIMGVQDLQIEGTGADPQDVVIDAGFHKLNALRADRADGIYLRNFTAQSTTFNAVYILETDGFVIDEMLGRWNDEYGFLTFATDHGLYTDCEAYGNGDSGVYPGSASNINKGRGHDVIRYAVEIRRCRSHHNLLGYSGTAGDSVWAHDNHFYSNSAGVSMDSAFPGHPGLPQNHALFEDNHIYNNNKDYYSYVRDGTCARPSAQRGYSDGVVCPATSVPVGTGVLVAGGNYNIFRGNWVYGNSYAGFALFWVPAFIRGESGLGTQFDTSHHNRYIGNNLGVTPSGQGHPNGMSFWWDGQGRGNCWQQTQASSDPAPLPACGSGAGSQRLISAPLKLSQLLVCGDYSLSEARVPAGCEWYGARGFARVGVQIQLISSALLAALAVLLWWRRLRGSALGRLAGTISAVLAAPVCVLGAVFGATLLPAAGLALLAAWWLCAAVALRRPHPGLASLTTAMGAVAIVCVIDKAIVLIPVIAVQPTWLLIMLTLVWVLWTVAALAPRRGSHETAETEAQAARTASG